MAEPNPDNWGRVQRGRYVIPDPATGAERKWTRATTLAETLDDSFGLTKWKTRAVAFGIGQRQDLFDLAAASDMEEDKRQLDRLCADAMKAAKADARANEGTAFHKFTQRRDMGVAVRQPKKWDEMLALYDKALAGWGIKVAPTMCERLTVIPELNVAGTLDKLVKFENTPTITDLKTGGNEEDGLVFGSMKMAIQLGLYSRGKVLWNFGAHKWDTTPTGVDQNRGLVIHMPVGGKIARLYEVDIALGWELANLAYKVREARKGKYLTEVAQVSL
ncbi:MAG: hypothetical protein ACREHG_05835 [Candidatus Saccharimonadales bacterium]